MFYLIGLGLNEEGFSWEAYKACQKCKKVYLESYTADFPYDIKKLEKQLETKVIFLNREQVESMQFLQQAKNQNIALLVYGSPLSATTHISLIQECKTKKIPYKIFHNASVLTAVAETGLHLYKFGKTTSLPAWQKSFKPTSFIEIIKENLSIKTHTLILVDISLELDDAINELKYTLKEHNIKTEKIILCSQLGYKSKVIYSDINKLPKKTEKPYCLIIPSDLHFTEKEFLESL